MSEKRGFSLLEVLLVIAIMMILAALLSPTLRAVKERGHQTTCLSNLRQIGMAVSLYTEDNDETLPIGAYNSHSIMPTAQWDFSWHDALLDYLQGKREIFYCPSADQSPDFRYSYGINPWVCPYWVSIKEARVTHPSAVVLATDHQTSDWCSLPWSWQYDPRHVYLTPRHGSRAEVLFADGRVRLLEPTGLNDIAQNWKPD